ncbi:MAG: hypothetical protein MJ252_29240, partial [archaeon]|nr:hypothetical protein [archaeon]
PLIQGRPMEVLSASSNKDAYSLLMQPSPRMPQPIQNIQGNIRPLFMPPNQMSFPQFPSMTESNQMTYLHSSYFGDFLPTPNKPQSTRLYSNFKSPLTQQQITQINSFNTPQKQMIIPPSAPTCTPIQEEPKPNYEPTFSLDDFTLESQPFVKLFICPLCDGILADALTDEYSHAYCQKCFICYNEFMERFCGQTQLCCPISHSVLSSPPVKFTMINGIISKKIIKCKNRNAGCNWTGEVGLLYSHMEKECSKQIISCKNYGCQLTLRREEMIIHEKICQFRIESCAYCNIQMAFKNLKEHQDKDCPKILIDCPQKCELKIERQCLESHIKNECPNTMVPCDFADIGCKMRIKKKDKDTHNKQMNIHHMMLLKDLYQYSDNQIKANKEETQTLRKEISPQIQRMNNEFPEIKNKIENLEKTQCLKTTQKNIKAPTFLGKKRKGTETPKSKLGGMKIFLDEEEKKEEPALLKKSCILLEGKDSKQEKIILKSNLGMDSEQKPKEKEDIFKSHLNQSYLENFLMKDKNDFKVEDSEIISLTKTENDYKILIKNEAMEKGKGNRTFTFTVKLESDVTWVGMGLCDVNQIKDNDY